MPGEEKRSKKRSAYRREAREGTVGDVNSAFKAIEALGSEMRETADNMDSNNLGATDKCQRCAEAADTLEGISAAEVPECLASVPISYGESVPSRKGRGTSRAVRLANAVELLQAAREFAEDVSDLDKSGAQERDEFVTELDSAISDAEGVEFPGMFG